MSDPRCSLLVYVVDDDEAFRDSTRCLLEAAGEVLERIVAGKPNKVIADDLGISIRTVEAHRAKVMEKTGTTTVAELVQISIDGQPAAAARLFPGRPLK